MAGGRGTRFGSATPKQFLQLKKKPVLLHTLEAFYQYSESIQVVLVLPEDDINTWKSLAQEHGFRRSPVLQAGGATRFQSVRRGLHHLPDTGYVAIHDGVRPLVSADLIARSFNLAKRYRSAIAAVPLKESLRVLSNESGAQSRAVDRSQYRTIQTPQTFEIGLIKQAYELPELETMTDDASVAENAGFAVHLFEGDYTNIKITNAEDLAIAETLMR